MLAPVVAAGAKYLTICSFHSGGGYIKPWPSQVPGSECTKRDFYGELITRASQLGIKVIVYINCDPNVWTFRNGVWLYESKRNEKGWTSYVFDVVDELLDRYGSQISGFWFDGAADGYGNGRTGIWQDQGTIAYIHDRYPNCIVCVNPGMDTTIFEGYDVLYGEFTDATPSPSYNVPSAYLPTRLISTDLCCEVPVFIGNDYIYWAGQESPRMDTATVIKSMVCVAGNRSRWDTTLITNPKIDGSPPTAVNTQMSEIGTFMAWAGESIYNTVAGGYIGGFCNDSSYVVTTKNGNTHYLHVLTKPTSDNFITVTNNGIQAARVINLNTGAVASFTQNGTSITINNSSWDSSDTIFKVIPTTNVSLGKTATGSITVQNPGYITDGQWNNSGDYAAQEVGVQWIKLDFGQSYNINEVDVWHYYGDGRTYHDVIVQLSNVADFSSGVTTVFNNDTDNSAGQSTGSDSEYSETSSGKVITFSPVNARYVRLWANGSTANQYNHYVEVSVWSN